MTILAFPGQMVQRWPRKGRTRDPLRRSARLARFSPFGGKWHPASSIPASESFSEQVLALLSLLGPCVLSLPWMPPCCLLQVAVGTPLGRGGVRVRPARWQTREVVRTLALACSFSSSPTGIFQYHSIRAKNPHPTCSNLLHPFLVRLLASLAVTVVLFFIPFCVSIHWPYEAKLLLAATFLRRILSSHP